MSAILTAKPSETLVFVNNKTVEFEDIIWKANLQDPAAPSVLYGRRGYVQTSYLLKRLNAQGKIFTYIVCRCHF